MTATGVKCSQHLPVSACCALLPEGTVWKAAFGEHRGVLTLKGHKQPSGSGWVQARAPSKSTDDLIA